MDHWMDVYSFIPIQRLWIISIPKHVMIDIEIECAIDENRMYFQIAIIGKIEFMFNVVSKMKFTVNLKVHDSFDVWLNEALCM